MMFLKTDETPAYMCGRNHHLLDSVATFHQSSQQIVPEQQRTGEHHSVRKNTIAEQNHVILMRRRPVEESSWAPESSLSEELKSE